MKLRFPQVAFISAVVLIILVAVVAVVSDVWTPSKHSSKLSPIVIVPGFTGSQLYATVAKPSPACPAIVNQTLLWMSTDAVRNDTFNCWLKNIFLNFDKSTNKTYSNDGVTVTAPNFGQTVGVEQMNPAVPTTKYFWAFVEAAVNDWGYERGKNIRAAPYDWRKAPNEAAEYFTHLKQLIEDTFEANDQKRISFLAHSMGNLYALHFLHSMSTEWLSKYIRAFYSIGAPWAGVPVTALVTTSGFKTIPVPDVIKMRTVQRSFPANYFLLPTTAAWRDDEVIVSTEKRNYTVNQFDELFIDLGIEAMAGPLYETVRLPKLVDVSKPPAVPTYCIIGTSVPTTSSFVYSAGRFPDLGPSQILFEDGDATVPTRSSSLCKRWTEAERTQSDLKNSPPRQPKVEFIALKNVTHDGLIAATEPLLLLRKLLVENAEA